MLVVLLMSQLRICVPASDVIEGNIGDGDGVNEILHTLRTIDGENVQIIYDLAHLGIEPT